MEKSMTDLEQVIADWREQATILASNGHGAQAESIRRVCDAVVNAAGIREYLDWLSEADAVAKSAKSKWWLRARFPGWVDRGLARWDPKRSSQRQFRSIVIPQRVNSEAAKAQARRDAEAA